MSDAPHLWVKETRKDVLAAGEARDLAEESANQSADRVAAPNCPACGDPVPDKEYESHARLKHNSQRLVVRPWGKPESREALFTAPNRELLDQKVAEWLGRHPGLRVEYAADGTDREQRLLWVRYFIKSALRKRVGQ